MITIQDVANRLIEALGSQFSVCVKELPVHGIIVEVSANYSDSNVCVWTLQPTVESLCDPEYVAQWSREIPQQIAFDLCEKIRSHVANATP